jgi:hypothetical protein
MLCRGSHDVNFMISMRSRARRLPFTLPYTTTSRATMSAVTFALAPTVSLRSSSWIRSFDAAVNVQVFVPEISPLTCRLDPSRAVPAGVVASGRMASVLIGLPSLMEQAGLAGFGVSGSLDGPGATELLRARFSFGLLFPHIGPPRSADKLRRQFSLDRGGGHSRPPFQNGQVVMRLGVRESNA